MTPSVRAMEDEKVVAEIRRVWEKSGKRYGARKVYAQLRREGIVVAGCTIGGSCPGSLCWHELRELAFENLVGAGGPGFHQGRR